MKNHHRKYAVVFLVFLSFLSPACNHPKQDEKVAAQQYQHKHTASYTVMHK